MKREVRIGILAIITLAFAIWAYNFVKGKNIFKQTKTFFVVFDNVDQLAVASPVSINGYNIGSVLAIELNPEDTKSILVEIEVDGKIAYPKDTKAYLKSSGVVGGKMITIEFDNPCSTGDCAQDGDYLQSESLGLIESIVGTDDINQYSSVIKESVGGALDTALIKLSDESLDNPINQSLFKMQETMENLSGATKSMNSLMKSSYSDMSTTFKNLATLSNSLAESNVQIKNLLINLEAISEEMRNVQLTPTIEATNHAISEATNLMGSVDTTLMATSTTFAEVTELLEKINNGDGTLSKLMNDKELYDNIEVTTENLNLLLQDLRLNPRRYLRLFGKKSSEYTLPENDPAFKN